MKWIGFLSVAGLVLVLQSCLCESELCKAGGLSIPVGGGASAPARPLAPPVNYAQDYDPERYEIHGAVTAADCKRMEARFKREGRRVRLIHAQPNPSNLKGGVLKYRCIFDGPDAEPVQPVFEDTRFPQSEYTYP